MHLPQHSSVSREIVCCSCALACVAGRGKKGAAAVGAEFASAAPWPARHGGAQHTWHGGLQQAMRFVHAASKLTHSAA